MLEPLGLNAGKLVTAVQLTPSAVMAAEPELLTVMAVVLLAAILTQLPVVTGAVVLLVKVLNVPVAAAP
jgi:hypothetical protein